MASTNPPSALLREARRAADHVLYLPARGRRLRAWAALGLCVGNLVFIGWALIFLTMSISEPETWSDNPAWVHVSTYVTWFVLLAWLAVVAAMIFEIFAWDLSVRELHVDFTRGIVQIQRRLGPIPWRNTWTRDSGATANLRSRPGKASSGAAWMVCLDAPGRRSFTIEEGVEEPLLQKLAEDLERALSDRGK
jgi:hypothetical protein